MFFQFFVLFAQKGLTITMTGGDTGMRFVSPKE